ncbi:MAG: histone deacetylase family protein [Pseudomonadota bacterium]
MSTLLITHPCYIAHKTPEGHPERPDRIRAVQQVLERQEFSTLQRDSAPQATMDQLAAAHPPDYIMMLKSMRPKEGDADLVRVDADTTMSAGSWEAALRAAGAACFAVDEVMAGKAQNAFCAIRPPGHHAEKDTAMGFCFFNSAAVAAYHARNAHGMERVAVVDFDVHHGNGTQDIFWDDADMMYASTHQMPLYPGTGSRQETGAGNIFNAPLAPGDDGAAVAEAFDSVVMPALENFSPDLLIISAGFDAHHRDPLANINLTEEDFGVLTRQMLDFAENHCGGRVVSLLEGGYDLKGLSMSVGTHVRALMGS